jgi:tetratricopeptide (TPR) repeat protein
LFQAHAHRLLGSVMVGDRATADADLAAMESLAARLRQPSFESTVRTRRAAHLLMSGRLDEGETEINSLSAFLEQHQLPPNGPASLMYRLHYERGRLGEIESLIAAMVETQPEVVTWRIALAGIYANTDKFELARAQLEVLAADDFAMVPRNNLWLVTIAGAARTAGVVGALDIAAWALEAMRPFAHCIAITPVSYEQPVGMSLGTAAAALGRWDDAEQLFAQALDVSERLGAPTFVAVTRVAWALALTNRGESGDVERARAMATLSLATAEELGLGRVAELSRRVLG